MASRAAKKDTPAPAADNDMGHNSELTPDERKALFFDHYRPIAVQLEKLREQQAIYKKLRKEAKAEGIELWRIDYALKCAEVEDENIMPERLKSEAEIQAWFALPVDFQPDMFGDFSREPGEDRARREGRKAGATGFGGNPYDEHSPLGRLWAEEWSAEQEKARAATVARMSKLNERIAAADDADPFAAAAE